MSFNTNKSNTCDEQHFNRTYYSTFYALWPQTRRRKAGHGSTVQPPEVPKSVSEFATLFHPRILIIEKTRLTLQVRLIDQDPDGRVRATYRGRSQGACMVVRWQRAFYQGILLCVSQEVEPTSSPGFTWPAAFVSLSPRMIAP